MTPPYTDHDYPPSVLLPSGLQSPQRSGTLKPPYQVDRQIRPPKSPMYVPAVLRPTEIPSRRPLTPPTSLHSSTDSLSRSKHSAAQPISIVTTLTRSSTASSGSITPSSIQPTRSHWKPDASATQCEAPGCSLAFSFLARRHHCRRCGGIYCANHAGVTVPLDENADINEGGSWHRACDGCFRDWDGYSRTSVGTRDSKSGPDRKQAKDIPGAGRKGSDAAGSVPKDWSWSTF